MSLKPGKLSGALLSVPIIVAGFLVLPGCTTVDLSQVREATRPVQETKPSLNVAERAASRLTTVFRTKGWTQAGPREKTQTAASVLLNGYKAIGPKPAAPSISLATLSADLALATDYIDQATKAAEIYMDMAEPNANFDQELSLLETAYLSAKDAERKFTAIVSQSGHPGHDSSLAALAVSLGGLKSVTDIYGERIRRDIANAAISQSQAGTL